MRALAYLVLLMLAFGAVLPVLADEPPTQLELNQEYFGLEIPEGGYFAFQFLPVAGATYNVVVLTSVEIGDLWLISADGSSLEFFDAEIDVDPSGTSLLTLAFISPDGLPVSLGIVPEDPTVAFTVNIQVVGPEPETESVLGDPATCFGEIPDTVIGTRLESGITDIGESTHQVAVLNTVKGCIYNIRLFSGSAIGRLGIDGPFGVVAETEDHDLSLTYSLNFEPDWPDYYFIEIDLGPGSEPFRLVVIAFPPAE